MKGPICFSKACIALCLTYRSLQKNYQLVIKQRNARGINETSLLNFLFCHSQRNKIRGKIFSYRLLGKQRVYFPRGIQNVSSHHSNKIHRHKIFLEKFHAGGHVQTVISIWCTKMSFYVV